MITVPSVNPSHPSTRHNSGWRPRRKVKHWTPKGDCKVTGNKERNPVQFCKENPFERKLTKKLSHLQIYIKNPLYEIPLKKNRTKKKFTKKLKSPSNLHEKSRINWSDLEKKYKRIPFKFYLGSFYREILCVFLQENSL